MIRIERAIRHLARERDHFLLRLEICGSERQEPGGYLRLEVTISLKRYREVLRMLERWKQAGDL